MTVTCLKCSNHTWTCEPVKSQNTCHLGAEMLESKNAHVHEQTKWSYVYNIVLAMTWLISVTAELPRPGNDPATSHTQAQRATDLARAVHTLVKRHAHYHRLVRTTGYCNNVHVLCPIILTSPLRYLPQARLTLIHPMHFVLSYIELLNYQAVNWCTHTYQSHRCASHLLFCVL